MRALSLLGLSTALLAQPPSQPAQPGLNLAFLARILESPDHGETRPWHTFRVPPESASATVEVLGEYTAEEWRQVKFNEFLAWFRVDYQKYMYRHGGGSMDPALPTERLGSNPQPRLVPLGRASF